MCAYMCYSGSFIAYTWDYGDELSMKFVKTQNVQLLTTTIACSRLERLVRVTSVSRDGVLFLLKITRMVAHGKDTPEGSLAESEK